MLAHARLKQGAETLNKSLGSLSVQRQ